jgi:hypothetical protein
MAAEPFAYRITCAALVSVITSCAFAQAPATSEAAFSKVASYGEIRFTVTSPQTTGGNRFTISPSGLQVSNEPLTMEVQGQVVDVLAYDMDGDNSPEVAVITEDGPAQKRQAHVFTTFARKSCGMVHFPPGTDPKLLAGYSGGDEFQFVENTFIRRFPLTEGGQKTGKFRQLQFKLKPGEATKQLVLDRQVEY